MNVTEWIADFDKRATEARKALAFVFQLGECPPPRTAQDVEALLQFRTRLQLNGPADEQAIHKAARRAAEWEQGQVALVLEQSLTAGERALLGDNTGTVIAGDLLKEATGIYDPDLGAAMALLLSALPTDHPAMLQPDQCYRLGWHKVPALVLGPPAWTAPGNFGTHYQARAWYHVATAIEVTRRWQEKQLERQEAERRAEEYRQQTEEARFGLQLEADPHHRINQLQARVRELEGQVPTTAK